MDQLKCLNPWDCHSKRQYMIDGVYPALNAGNGAGGQAHGVCYEVQMDEAIGFAWANSGKAGLSADKTAPTIKASQCGESAVVCAAFMGGQGANARSIAYCDDGTTLTLKATPSGSNMVPDVCIASDHVPVVCLNFQGSKGNNMIAENGKSYSLNAMHGHDVHVVCYGISRSMLKGGMNAGEMPVEEQIQPAMTSNGCGAVCYDGRGNSVGGGGITPTMTGDHNNRITDYTAIVVTGNESTSDDNRGAVRKQPSGELHWTGCVQRYAAGDQEDE